MEVPFKLQGAKIVLEARCADTVPLRLVFDTGFTGDLLRFNNEEIARKCGYVPARESGQPIERQKLRVPPPSAEMWYANRHAPPPRVDIGEVSISPRDSMVTRIGSRSDLASKHYGLADGLVGDYLFNRWVVEIDFSTQVLRLHEREGYTYRGHGTVHYHSFRAWPEFLIPTRIRFATGDEVPLTLLVDTGFGLDVVINDSALRQEVGLGSPHKVWYWEIDDSCFLKRATLRLGGVEIRSALVSLCPDPPPRHSPRSLVGLGILSRFRVIIDEKRKRVILEPTDRLAQRTEVNMLGVRWERKEIGDSPKVGTVETGSSADRAGLRKGDLVVAINGRPTADLPGWQMIDLAIGRWGRELEFRVRRTSGETTVKVILVPPL